MAQTIKNRIRTLATKYDIDAIIKMAKEVKEDMADEQAWNNLTDKQKLDWFYAQCKKYKLTTEQFSNQIAIKELPAIGKHRGTRAYFCAFLPESLHKEGHRDGFHVELGSAYLSSKNDGIWSTHPGLKGKERQIAEVIRLHKLGK